MLVQQLQLSAVPIAVFLLQYYDAMATKQENDMTKEQKGARSALVLDLTFRGIKLTDAEMRTVLEGDIPFAEWPDELKQKTAPLSEIVRVEDERAAASSQGK